MGYHVSGLISVFFFVLCLGGIVDQIQNIRRNGTSVLSLNQFFTSYLAFFSYFIYGYCIDPFNHYLVWPRLVASALVITILYYLAVDRREWKSASVFVISSLALVTGILFLVFGPKASLQGKTFSQALIVVTTVLLVQGYTHQALVIRKQKDTGAVSLRMHQMLLLKDISSFALGVFMGLSNGWPILLLNGLSALTKVTVIQQIRRASSHSK